MDFRQVNLPAVGAPARSDSASTRGNRSVTNNRIERTRGVEKPVLECGAPRRSDVNAGEYGPLAQLRRLRLKEYVCFIIRCLQSFGQRPAVIFSHAVLPFQKIGDILRFDAYFNTAQAG